MIISCQITQPTHTHLQSQSQTHTQLIWKLPDVHPLTVDVLVEILQNNETQTLTLSLCVPDVSLKMRAFCVFWELLICNAKLWWWISQAFKCDTHTDMMLIYSLFRYFQSDRLRRSDRYKASRRNSNELLGKSWIFYAEEELKILLYYTRFNLLIVYVYVHLKEIFCLDFAYESWMKGDERGWKLTDSSYCSKKMNLTAER